MIEEEIGKLVTDDPSVIETSLEKYGELVYPEISSVLRRYVYMCGIRERGNTTFLSLTIGK